MALKHDRLDQYAKAITWLADGQTVTAVAKRLKVARATIYAWQNDPVFAQMRANVSHAAEKMASNELKVMALDACKSLADAMAAKQDEETRQTNRVRIRAATVVLRTIGMLEQRRDPVEDMEDDDLDALIERLAPEIRKGQAN